MKLPTSVLPPALVELTILRAGPCVGAPRLRVLAPVLFRRSLHTEALNTTPPPPPLHGQTRYTLPFLEKNGMIPPINPHQAGPLSELERRVQALEEIAAKESQVLEPPSYTEEELTAFYENLLAIPTVQLDSEYDTPISNERQTQAEEDIYAITQLEKRLLNHFPHEDANLLTENGYNAHTRIGSASQSHLRILAHLQNVVAGLETIQGSSATPAAGIISVQECEALVRICLQAKDQMATEKLLDLMKRLAIPLPGNAITEVMKFYANSGDMEGVERVMSTYLTDTPSEQQRHFHIKAHLMATPTDALPTQALQVLHNYELQSSPAPIQTYTSVITSLFSRPSSLARAQAWDLFSHMRYAAHSQPDVLLYTLMIRACASPVSSARSSEPERALDLWTEMTVDHRIMPTAGAYNAVILACAKSGLRRYVAEAFRLAKEMLDSHRDAEGRAAFRPDRKTFCALLEGAKRVGDLARARWILAEMVRGVGPDGYSRANKVDVSINEEVMMHVFHAYAAYDPPFVRSIAPLAKTPSEGSSDTAEAESSGLPISEDIYPSFTHIPPQSRQEVIHEARTLFHRILADTEGKLDTALPSEHKFQRVTLTTRLLNSYLSIFFRHSSLEESRDMFWKLYDELGVERSPRTYIEALERCGRTRKGRERLIATQFAEELWEKWQVIEQSKQDGSRPLSPRFIERARTAMMRTLAITGNLDKAMTHLREFVGRYSPQAVRQPLVKPAMRSTRTSLIAPRPLVRLTSNADVPDDHVPPFLTFGDIEVLHHRLIASESEDAREKIGYIKWVCKAYEWALRGRRDETLKAQVEKQEPGIVSR